MLRLDSAKVVLFHIRTYREEGTVNLASAHPVENEFGEVETTDVVVRCYTSVGTVQGLGKIEVEARESVIPDRRHTAYFVKFLLESSDEYPRQSFALVHYDHLDKLIESLERLTSITIKTDRFSFTEVEYDVDGLSIVVFNTAQGQVLFAVGSGGVQVHFRAMSQLSDLKNLVVRAKAHLDKNRVDF